MGRGLIFLRLPERDEGQPSSGLSGLTGRPTDFRETAPALKTAHDPEAVAAIREAERIFNEVRARGATAFKVEPGKPVERIEKFDRTAEQIVMVPRVVGG
jgi:hypothetical protein